MKSSFFRLPDVKSVTQNSQLEQGFTLIELLVTVTIIGVLSSIALPNLLAQIGKAREAELRSTVGTINRAQQALHFEKQFFTTSLSALGVTLTQQYQAVPIISTDTTTYATIRTDAPSYQTNGLKAFAGRVEYSSVSAEYSAIICGSNSPAQSISAPSTSNTCPGGSGVLR